MKLISSSSSQFPVRKGPEPVWLPAVKSTFGDFAGFAAAFPASPERQAHCADNMLKAVAMGDRMPSLNRAVIAYGKRQIASLLNTHLSLVIAAWGEHGKIKDVDTRILASFIASNKKCGVLRFSTVIAFFHQLSMGELKIWGEVTNRKILEKYAEYCEAAIADESRIRRDLERLEEQRRDAEERRDAISWPERARRLGLPEGTSFTAYVLSQASQSDNQ